MPLADGKVDAAGADSQDSSSGPQGSSTEARQARGYQEHQQGPSEDLVGGSQTCKQLSSTAERTGLNSLAASGSPCEQPSVNTLADTQQLDQQLEAASHTNRISIPAGELKIDLGEPLLQAAGKLQEPARPAEGVSLAGDDAAGNKETVKEAAVELLEPAGQAMLQQLGDTALQEQQLTPGANWPTAQPCHGSSPTWPQWREAVTCWVQACMQGS